MMKLLEIKNESTYLISSGYFFVEKISPLKYINTRNFISEQKSLNTSILYFRIIILNNRMIPKNTIKVVNWLLRNTDKPGFNVNQIAEEVGISPSNAFYIINELKKDELITIIDLKTAIYYKLDLWNEKTRKLAELVLLQNDFNSYSKVIADDLKPLKEISLSCVLFGSILEKGINAGDIDIMIVLRDKEDFKKVNKILNEIKEMKTKKIHDLMLTKDDLIRNIRKKDEVILDIIKKGFVIFGSETIVGAIKDGTS